MDFSQVAVNFIQQDEYVQYNDSLLGGTNASIFQLNQYAFAVLE